MNAESTREALDVASLAGDILLASGAEIFRVEETIDRIALCSDLKAFLWKQYGGRPRMEKFFH